MSCVRGAPLSWSKVAALFLLQVVLVLSHQAGWLLPVAPPDSHPVAQQYAGIDLVEPEDVLDESDFAFWTSN